MADAVIDSPSSSSAPAASSAPSTSPSTPTSTPSATPESSPSAKPERTSSFGEALKQAAAKLESARPPTPAPVSQPEAATTAPETGQPLVTKEPGPVPVPVHLKALENARIKARTEVEQEFRSQYGGAPDDVRQVMSWASEAVRDPVAHLERTFQSALANPDLAPKVVGLAARILNGRKPQTAAPVSTTFQPADFRDEAGNEFFSAKTMMANLEAIKAQVLEELQPIKEEVGKTVAERAKQEADATLTRQRQAMKTALDGHLMKARNLPQFKEHEAEIKAALLKEPLTTGHPAEEALLLREVYERIVLPKLSVLQQDQAIQQLKKDATASGLNPAATGTPSGVPKHVQAKHGGTMGAAIRWAQSQTQTR